jgi:hypothetical protein
MLAAGKFETLTRVGFAARGIMYILVGVLALRAGRTEDGAGALSTLDSGWGRLALAAMALGFLAYGLWRLSEAAIDTQGHGKDAKGAVVRASGAVSGLIHLALAAFTARLALGAGRGGSGGDSTRDGAAAALDLPGGTLLLGLAAVALLVAGGFQLVRAVRADFVKNLDPEAAHRPWVIWLGRAGHGARGIVFLLIGWFLARSAWSDDAGEAGGIEKALDSLPESLRMAVAAGLLLFGLFSLVEARHRRIADTRVLQRLKALG